MKPVDGPMQQIDLRQVSTSDNIDAQVAALPDSISKEVLTAGPSDHLKTKTRTDGTSGGRSFGDRRPRGVFRVVRAGVIHGRVATEGDRHPKDAGRLRERCGWNAVQGIRSAGGPHEHPRLAGRILRRHAMAGVVSVSGRNFALGLCGRRRRCDGHRNCDNWVAGLASGNGGPGSGVAGEMKQPATAAHRSRLQSMIGREIHFPA